jgi:isoamyl acetate esterase
LEILSLNSPLRRTVSLLASVVRPTSLSNRKAPSDLAFADAYARSFDVINRGFSGYNSRWDAIVLKQILPTCEQREKQNLPNIRLFTIWLGANDSVTPDSPQHVPLNDFCKDMTAMIGLIRERSPGAHIILITPGPAQVSRWDLERNHRNRSNAQIEQYVHAVKDVGAEHDVPVVDAYEAIWAAACSREEEALQQFYTDGLHFAAPGYEVGRYRLVCFLVG